MSEKLNKNPEIFTTREEKFQYLWSSKMSLWEDTIDMTSLPEEIKLALKDSLLRYSSQISENVKYGRTKIDDLAYFAVGNILNVVMELENKDGIDSVQLRDLFETLKGEIWDIYRESGE